MNFEYSTNRKDREKFIDFCNSLRNENLSKDTIHKYSTLLNRYYPKSSMYGSHNMNQWSAARNNIDNLFALNGIEPPKHPSTLRQITIGLIVGVGTFLITTLLTVAGAIFLSSDDKGQIKLSGTVTNLIDSQLNIQSKMQAESLPQSNPPSSPTANNIKQVSPATNNETKSSNTTNSSTTLNKSNHSD